MFVYLHVCGCVNVLFVCAFLCVFVYVRIFLCAYEIGFFSVCVSFLM